MTNGYTIMYDGTQTLREWIAANGRQSIAWIFFLTDRIGCAYYKKSPRYTKRELNGRITTLIERCGKYELTVEL